MHYASGITKTSQAHKVFLTISARHCTADSLLVPQPCIIYPACPTHQTRWDELHPPFALIFLSLPLLGFAGFVQESDQDHGSPDAGPLVVEPSSGLRHARRFCRCRQGFRWQPVQGQASSRVPGLQDLLCRGFSGFQCEFWVSQSWFCMMSNLEKPSKFQPKQSTCLASGPGLAVRSLSVRCSVVIWL